MISLEKSIVSDVERNVSRGQRIPLQFVTAADDVALLAVGEGLDADLRMIQADQQDELDVVSVFGVRLE